MAKAFGKCKAVNAGKKLKKHDYVAPDVDTRVTVGGVDTRTTVELDTRTTVP